MTPTELELYTTQELIDELVRRSTFLGVVVHAHEELKAFPWNGERLFKIHFNANLNRDEALRLLGTVAEKMSGEPDGEIF